MLLLSVIVTFECHDFIDVQIIEITHLSVITSGGITADFTWQIVCLKTIILSQNLQNINNLCIFIIEMDLSSSYPDVLTACLLFLTLPITCVCRMQLF
jgi:hypothetical protein